MSLSEQIAIKYNEIESSIVHIKNLKLENNSELIEKTKSINKQIDSLEEQKIILKAKIDEISAPYYEKKTNLNNDEVVLKGRKYCLERHIEIIKNLKKIRNNIQEHINLKSLNVQNLSYPFSSNRHEIFCLIFNPSKEMNFMELSLMTTSLKLSMEQKLNILNEKFKEFDIKELEI